MKVITCYCDICRKQITELEINKANINKIKYELCDECLKELREKTQKIIDEMKIIKFMKGGE